MYRIPLLTLLVTLVASAVSAQQNVTWVNITHASLQGTTLTKTIDCDGCNDSGAVSQQQISSGTGSVQFQSASTNLLFYIGLGNNFSTPPTVAQLAYSISFGSAGCAVYESGTYKT